MRALLLKDLGCSSNAARICQLYVGEDLSFKRDFKWVDGSLLQGLRFVPRHTSYTEAIWGRVRIFEELSLVSAAHHERLDGPR